MKEQSPYIAKKTKANLAINRTIYKILSLSDVQTHVEFFKQLASLKKSFPKHYFISFQKDLSNKNLVALCELLTTKIGKPQRKLYAIQGTRA